MSQKSLRTTYHTLRILLGVLMLIAAVGKLFGIGAAVEMMSYLGLNIASTWAVGLLELLASVFLLSRTFAWVGGFLVAANATLAVVMYALEAQTLLLPALVVVLWAVAVMFLSHSTARLDEI
jgi:hypothetical protein